MTKFPCNQCGICCQRVHWAEETKFLDRGDGVCKHYAQDSKLCTIYAQRPEICRVDRQYILHYENKYDWNEFVALNLQVCAALESQPTTETA
ncbi:MAG: YkgJ family cysteine cluster protein [Burkholderiaceae bacterium]|nr:YkgJ family cysteine cluster protein [Burkholderiaceae bacterium]